MFIYKSDLNKLIPFCLYSFLSIFLISVLLTRNLQLSFLIAFLDSLVKILLIPALGKSWKNTREIIARPAVIWLTGLSCAGKTTIANCLIERFGKESVIPVLLDGDEIRNLLRVRNFDEESRKKHNLYVGYLASILEKQGKIVIVSLISPYSEIRNEVRGMCKNFIEVYVSTDLEICIQRDVKNQYQRAIAGEIKDFTGISAPYFPPEKPELVIDNGTKTFTECTKIIFEYYRKHK